MKQDSKEAGKRTKKQGSKESRKQGRKQGRNQEGKEGLTYVKADQANFFSNTQYQQFKKNYTETTEQ